MKAEARVWVVRGGRHGDNDAWLLEHGLVAIDYSEFPDLSGVQSRDEMVQLATRLIPNQKENALRNWAAQLWAFSSRMQQGDLVILPQKSTRQLHVGRVAGDYQYVDEGPDSIHHRRQVEWLRTHVPRTVVEQDLLYSIGAFSTVFEVSRNDAAFRIRVIASAPDAVDPGPRVTPSTRNSAAVLTPTPDDEDLADAASESGFDVNSYITDSISARIRSRFAGHRLELLVEALLEAEGFVITQRPSPGTDSGVDILAGRGVFGMDEPRIAVQVKSEPGAVGDPVVAQLHGAITRSGADQGLLVAVGGVNKNAEALLAGHRFKIAVWDEARLLRAIFENYEALPADIRVDLPLRQRWILAEE